MLIHLKEKILRMVIETLSIIIFVSSVASNQGAPIRPLHRRSLGSSLVPADDGTAPPPPPPRGYWDSKTVATGTVDLINGGSPANANGGGAPASGSKGGNGNGASRRSVGRNRGNNSGKNNEECKSQVPEDGGGVPRDSRKYQINV